MPAVAVKCARPNAADNSYAMDMLSAKTGKRATFNYRLQRKQHAPESTAYFVLEHQPDRCKAYPTDGEMSFENIYVEVDGKARTWYVRYAHDGGRARPGAGGAAVGGVGHGLGGERGGARAQHVGAGGWGVVLGRHAPGGRRPGGGVLLRRWRGPLAVSASGGGPESSPISVHSTGWELGTSRGSSCQPRMSTSSSGWVTREPKRLPTRPLRRAGKSRSSCLASCSVGGCTQSAGAVSLGAVAAGPTCSRKGSTTPGQRPSLSQQRRMKAPATHSTGSSAPVRRTAGMAKPSAAMGGGIAFPSRAQAT